MISVSEFDAGLHTGKVSRGGRCGQGGSDACHAPPTFSVVGEDYNVATCDEHLPGAVRQALGMSSRQVRR